MKITNRNARIDREGKHNDRNFDLSKATHIDKSKVHLNKYYTYNGDLESSFESVEKEFYRIMFSDKIEQQNERNNKVRHSERNKTIEDYYKGTNTKPEDKVLQIGDFFNHVDGELLWKCALEYAAEFDKKFGDHCKILDMALHMDEATPHVHIRRVWIAEDEYGNKCVSQNKALNQMGFEVDDSQNSLKYNNKTIFTAVENEMFQDICKEYNIDIDNSKPAKNQRHLDMANFKLQNIQKLMDKEQELTRTIDNLEKEKKALQLDTEQMKLEIEDQIDPVLDMFYQNQFLLQFDKELEQIKKEKSKIKQLNLLNELYKSKAEYVFQGDFELSLIRNRVERELSIVKEFLDRYGLSERYNDFRDSIKDKKVEYIKEQSR